MKRRRDQEQAAVVAAEDGLISILLVDPALLAQCPLSPDDWQCAEYALIYEQMQRLFMAGQTVNMQTVGMSLGASLEAVGGVPFFMAIAEDMYPGTTVGFPTYIEHVQRVSRNRRVAAALKAQLDEFRREPFSDGFAAGATTAVATAAEGGASSAGRDWSDICDSAADEVVRRHRGEDVAGPSTGIDALDQQIQCMGKGEQIIIAARPGMGKSALSSQIAINCAGRGERVAIFNLEMRGESMVYRDAAYRAGVPLSLMQKGRIEVSRLVARTIDAINETRGFPIRFYEDPRQDASYVRREACALKAKSGLDLVVIDYLQLMSGDRKLPREQQVSVLSRELKLLAKELQVPVLTLAQLNRDSERSGRRPQLSDLRESGSIEQDADMVWFIHQEDREDRSLPAEREIIVAKGRAGGAGDVPVMFDGRFG